MGELLQVAALVSTQHNQRLMKSPKHISLHRRALTFVAFTALSACASPPPVTTEAAPNILEVKIVTGFRLDVTAEEETLTEKKIRAVAETEITSVRRAVSKDSVDQCISAVRPGDAFVRSRETAPGRMALTGSGATLDQSGSIGRITARPRVYFLGPMESADTATKHQLSDFIVTSPDFPALAGAQFYDFRLDIVATQAGDQSSQPNCAPDLGASRPYEGSGERRALVWHGLDLMGVPERYFAAMLQDTQDVSIAILDSVTRVPIANAGIKIENLDGGFMSFPRFVEQYLAGVKDAFILDLYAEFADSAFFEFTRAKDVYKDGDKIRLLKDRILSLQVVASAPGYLPVTGQADIGAGQTNLQVFMSPEGAADSGMAPTGVKTN